MKNLYLYFMVLLLCNNGYGQNKDVIVFIDNSSSINTTEFAAMQQSINLVIQEILLCNNNRVAVVHFGTPNSNGTLANIFIESDFTSNITTALNFTRRSGFIGTWDHPHESLSVLGQALDAIPNPLHILSPTTTLNRISSNELVVSMFTDACRRPGGSTSHGLVNPFSFVMNSNEAFQNYTSFKNDRLARFVVNIVPPTICDPILAIEAAASIASAAGGTYNGAIESYPADPQVGELNRYLVVSNNFTFSNADIVQTVANICEDCLADLILTSPLNNVTATSQQERSNSILATNIINNPAGGERAVYHAGNFVELNPGFEALYGSQFSAYIQECTAAYVYRTSEEADASTKQELERIDVVSDKIKIYPNPSNSMITISYDSQKIKNIMIASIDGKVVLQQFVNSHAEQIDVSGFTNGLYLITVQTEDGRSIVNKFIKN
jgi:hypothetical protein